MRKTRGCGRNGNSMVEFALIAPWYFFLFAGTLQTGFTLYGLMAVQNAARVAAIHVAANKVAAGDQAGACAIVIQELQGLPNINSSFNSNCSAAPVTVTVNYCDDNVPCNGTLTSVDNGPAAFVSVKYNLPAAAQFPVPGLTSITRTMEMRLRDPLP
jgi:Flp pilus assembly protein TadG